MRFKIDWASFIFGINLPFLLCFPLYLRAIFQVQAPGGRFNGGFFALPVWGAYIWKGLIHGGAYFRNFTVIPTLSWVYSRTSTNGHLSTTAISLTHSPLGILPKNAF